MRGTTFLAAAVFAAVTLLPLRGAQSEDEPGETQGPVPAAEFLGSLRHALVIGIDPYADKGIEALTRRERDARAVLAVLTDPQRGGVPEANVQALLGAEATHAKIRAALERLKTLPREATVFVHFAGHGAVKGEGTYWVAHDTKPKRLARTAIAAADVRRILEEVPAERILLTMDCCHGRSLAGDAGRDHAALLRSYHGVRYATLGASAAKEMVLGEKEDAYSVFSHYLALGLAGKADADDSGVVSLAELGAYVDRRVSARILKLPGLQRPAMDLAGKVEAPRFLLTVEPEEFALRLEDEAPRLRRWKGRLSALKALLDKGRITSAQAGAGRHWLGLLQEGLQEHEAEQRALFVDLVEGRLDVAHLATALEAVRRTDRKTLVVPDEFKTIMAAIDAASAGDTVHVKAGTYHEHVLFKTGLHLRGDGPEKTLLRMVTGKEEILLAEGCAWGLIEALQFDGTGGEQLGDWNPDGLHLKGSSIRVRDCLAYKCLGAGLYAEGKGCRPHVRDCTFEENIYDGAAFKDVDGGAIIDCICRSNGAVGFQVRDSRGDVVIRDCESTLCKDAGIGVCGGSTVTLIDNTCNRNGAHGILAWDAGTSIAVEGNTCSHNGIFGIYLVQGATAVVRSCECERNKEGGIVASGAGSRATIAESRCLLNARGQSGWRGGVVFSGGARGEVTSSTCDGNFLGILVTGKGTSAEVRDNTCGKNESGGIVFGDSATGKVTENRCHENTHFGIHVSGQRTRADVVKNACNENGDDGIRFSQLAGGVADGNECDGNGVFGISAYNYGTRPTIRNNRCTHNGKAGISKQEGAAPVIESNNVLSD